MKMIHGWAAPDFDEIFESMLNPDGTYQATHLADALEYVTDFSLAIDGGAHIGTWSRPMSQRFDHVIACEPSEDTYEALVANMGFFGCSNVEARKIALGKAKGSVSIVLDERAAEMKNSGARHTVSGGSIPCETIDSWRLPSCGFIKLDIEGAEPFALEGCVKTLKRCRPIVLYEDKGLWKRHHRLPRDIVAKFLTSVGYRHLKRSECDEIWGPEPVGRAA